MKTLFGIKNCDTVKKAINWLESRAIEFSFHNLKTEGIDVKTLNEWCNQVGWKNIVNKKSTTWRNLSPEIQSTITSQEVAIAVLMENTNLIKRPIISENRKVLTIGFSEGEFEKQYG